MLSQKQLSLSAKAATQSFSQQGVTLSACASARWRAVLRNSIHVKSRNIREKEERGRQASNQTTYTSSTVRKSASPSPPGSHARTRRVLGSAQTARAPPSGAKAAALGGPAARERASPRHRDPAARMARREPEEARRTVGVGDADADAEGDETASSMARRAEQPPATEAAVLLNPARRRRGDRRRRRTADLCVILAMR